MAFHPYLNPRRIIGATAWFAFGAGLTLATAAALPGAPAWVAVSILPTLALLKAATQSLLPALLLGDVLCAGFALGRTDLPASLCLAFPAALLAIFLTQRWVERIDANHT